MLPANPSESKRFQVISNGFKTVPKGFKRFQNGFAITRSDGELWEIFLGFIWIHLDPLLESH